MADQKVNIKVTAQGAKKAQKDIGGLDGSIKKLGRSVLNASVAYFGTQGLINGIIKSAELAGVQEQAEKQLEFALGKTSTALLNQASALQKVTTFGDEAIISQQAFLASLEFSEEQINSIISASVDLASATGISLESAVRNTAKTFSGLSGELGELIPQLRGLTTEQMKAGDAVKVISQLFGGQAQVQAQTYAGSVEQLKNELGDMAENVGKIVIPIFQKLTPHLKTAINFWQNYLNVGEQTSEQTNKYDVEIKSLNEQIEYQQSLIQGLGRTGEELNGTTERHNQLRKRAYDQGNTLIEQRDLELQQISELIKKQDRLREQKELDAKIEEALARPRAINLEIRRKEIDLLGNIEEVQPRIIQQNELTAETAIAFGDAFQQALGQTSSLLATTAGKNKTQQILSMRLSQLSAVASIASGVAKGFEQGGVLGFLTGASIASAGAVQIATIEKAISDATSLKTAETGFEGVVTKPTLFLTGENNKPEQVSVTPLGGEPSAGININVQGNMIGNEEFVRDVLIPEMSNARNQNLA
jgi:hypothetical protein